MSVAACLLSLALGVAADNVVDNAVDNAVDVGAEDAAAPPLPSTTPPPASNAAQPSTTTTTMLDPNAAATSAWTLPPDRATGAFLAAQIFAGGDALFAETSTTAVPAFRLDRAEAGGGFVYDGVAGLLLRVETIRSASPQSAFGIDGDSLLPRLRLGFGVVRPRFDVAGVVVVVEGRVGLIPNLWLSRLEPRSGTRGLVPLGSERAGQFGTSDLGASVSLDVADVAFAAVSVENGEGKNEVERNVDKDVTVVVGGAVDVATVFDDAVAVGAHGVYRHGSVGAGSARNDRAGVAVFATHRLAHVGTEVVWGGGSAGRADVEPLVVGTFADVQLWPSVVGLALRHDAVVADLDVDDALSHQATVALFTDFGLAPTAWLQRVRLFVGGEGRVAGANAGPVPGVPAAGTSWRAFVTLEVSAASPVLSLR